MQDINGVSTKGVFDKGVKANLIQVTKQNCISYISSLSNHLDDEDLKE